MSLKATGLSTRRFSLFSPSWNRKLSWFFSWLSVDIVVSNYKSTATIPEKPATCLSYSHCRSSKQRVLLLYQYCFKSCHAATLRQQQN
jgi:hypothetical protein